MIVSILETGNCSEVRAVVVLTIDAALADVIIAPTVLTIVKISALVIKACLLSH